MPTITARDLTKRYGRTLAVDRLSFSAPAGAVTALLGPNGCGKTTAMRMLLGLVRPTAGTATVLGHPYAGLADPGRRVGVALDADAVHPGRTGRAHLRWIAVLAGIPEDRVEPTLRRVGLDDAGGRRVRTYSLGMRQRLALGGALLGDPELLVLDEPANGLDPDGIRWLRTTLRALAAEGRTVLLSSHQLWEVERTADRVLVMAGGRLVADGTVDEVTEGGRLSMEDVVLGSPAAAEGSR